MVGTRAAANVLLSMGPRAGWFGASERWYGEMAADFKRARHQSLDYSALGDVGGDGHLAGMAGRRVLPVGVI